MTDKKEIASLSPDDTEDGAPDEREATDALLELVVVPERHARIDGVVVARLDGAPPGEITVTLPGAGAPVPARMLATVAGLVAGAAVAVVCEGGDPRRPIILGVVTDPNAAALSSAIPSAPAHEPAPEPTERELSVTVDGRRIVLEAEEEIMLKCGAASITLTRAGKILVRGAYLSSRSSGAHRIRGASVEIN